ncbi:MAG: hypothetical protein JWP89_2755 [Schlesneria sp.]|nr:hypothetical protein [Schlesneria sp.]
MREFFRSWRRKVGSVTLVMTAYVAAYFAAVEAVPSGIYRTHDGLFPKTTVYPLGSRVGFGKSPTYRGDPVTQLLFSPINAIDRKLRPSVWLE